MCANVWLPSFLQKIKIQDTNYEVNKVTKKRIKCFFAVYSPLKYWMDISLSIYLGLMLEMQSILYQQKDRLDGCAIFFLLNYWFSTTTVHYYLYIHRILIYNWYYVYI